MCVCVCVCMYGSIGTWLEMSEILLQPHRASRQIKSDPRRMVGHSNVLNSHMNVLGHCGTCFFFLLLQTKHPCDAATHQYRPPLQSKIKNKKRMGGWRQAG